MLTDGAADLSVADVIGVLTRDHNRLHPHRTVALVLHRHLRLTIGPQPLQVAVVTSLRQPSSQPVGECDRQRHHRLGLVTRETEHQPLVPGAARIHAHGDVGRLRIDRRDHGTGLVVETVDGSRISDALDGAADDRREIHVDLGGDLTEQ